MIKIRFQSLLLASLLGLSAASAFAEELKIGFINTERVFREAPAAITAGKKMEVEFGPRSQQIKQLAADIEAKQQYFVDKAATLSDSQRRAKEAEITELSVQLKRRQQELQEDISLRQSEENSAIIEKTNAAIKKIAEMEHFDLIVQEAVAVSQRIDITDKVIRVLAGDK